MLFHNFWLEWVQHWAQKDINLKGIVESYIEYNEPDTVEIEKYEPGLILKAKGSDSKNYYSVVVVSFDGPDRRIWQYYLFNLETLRLTPVSEFENIIRDYETFDNFNYTDLLLRIKWGDEHYKSSVR